MARKTVKFPKEIISHYLSTLQKQINVQGALVFGSYAWGKPTKHSDVDLIVLSSDFKRIKDPFLWLARQRDAKTYNIAMDVIGYTPKEFADIEKHSVIMAKAKKEGKWLIK